MPSKHTKSFIDLEGSIKTKVKYSDSLADKKVSDYIAKQYKKLQKAVGALAAEPK